MTQQDAVERYGTLHRMFFEQARKLADRPLLLDGRSGKIRFDLEPEPLLPRWIRRLRQLLQKRYQI